MRHVFPYWIGTDRTLSWFRKSLKPGQRHSVRSIPTIHSAMWSIATTDLESPCIADSYSSEYPPQPLRPCVLVRLKIRQNKISLLSIHPRAPIRSGHFKKRNDMLAWAADRMKELESPKICIGDLNSSPWSPYYQELQKQTQLLDVRTGFGLLPSWPTFMGLKALMIPIDHCLVSSDFRILGVRTGERVGSDHLPLIVDLTVASETKR
jgi:endonuclease/exonuclease/phosphatase family metal-dependent hydrolase